MRKTERDFHNVQGKSPLSSVTSTKYSTHLDNNDFIGRSSAFESILEMINAVAARRCSVIITGETGVGKEMVARQIHNASDRADKVFVPVDCTTLTGQLFESQLFGHTKGAFTGAIDTTLGFFRAADGGTIFLDEISEIPLELQAKLLRVLQQAHDFPTQPSGLGGTAKTRAPPAEETRAVASVDPSSTTSTSAGTRVCPRSDFRRPGMTSSSSRAGMTTLTWRPPPAPLPPRLGLGILHSRRAPSSSKISS